MTHSIEPNSTTWGAVSGHLTKRLQWLRERNDDQNLTDAETDILRGRIQEVKDLLELPKKHALDKLKKISLAEVAAEAKSLY